MNIQIMKKEKVLGVFNGKKEEVVTDTQMRASHKGIAFGVVNNCGQ